MRDNKIVAIVIILFSLVVGILVNTVITYFTNKGYDYQTAKSNTGMVFFFLGILGYIILKITFRIKKK